MNTENIFLILIIILGFLFLFFIIKNFQKSFEEKIKSDKEERVNEKNGDQSQIILQGQITKLIETNEKISLSNEKLKSELTEKINEKLNQNQKEMSRSVENQFLESQKLIKNITEELQDVKKTSGEVASFAEGLQNLQNILQNSKQRGALGEYFLESTIKNILPVDSYEFQYLFKDKTIVDAVIKLPEGIVPVDSKFSLENYNNFISENNPERKKEFQKIFREDLKKRVSETAKYIKPRENTMDFAFMFIPSEGIYYDLLTSRIGADVDSSKIGEDRSQNFLEYAFREKKVIVVSPTTLHAYLQTVMQGLKALRIEKKAGEIGKKVEDLQKHIQKYSQTHKKVGAAITTAVNQYNLSSKSLKQISNDTIKITGSGKTIEENLIERPHLEEDHE
jgi:DNA recombination protein RmuC